jgi:hypothetical protein
MSETNIHRQAYETLAKNLNTRRGRESAEEFHDRLVGLAAKRWEVTRAVARETIETRWARQLYDNLVKHLGIARAEDETATVFRERAQSEIGARWDGYSGTSIRAFFNFVRRPSFNTGPKFYADLVEFGRAKFDAKGKVIPESLNKGPAVRQFLDVTPIGKEKGAATRAA